MSDVRVKTSQGWRDAQGTPDGRVIAVLEARNARTYSDSVTAALSKKTTCLTDYGERRWKLVHVSATFSTAPTTSENFTVTLNPGGTPGNRPSTVIFSIDPSSPSLTSVENIWEDGGRVMQPGDEVTVAYTNTDTRTVKVEIVTEAL